MKKYWFFIERIIILLFVVFGGQILHQDHQQTLAMIEQADSIVRVISS